MTFIPKKQLLQLPHALSMLLLVAVSAGLSARADAHSGGRVFPVAYLTDEMLEQIQVDDGSVDEWFELIGEPAMTLLDFSRPDSNYLPGS